MAWDNPRDPRPKGSQKGTVRRDSQHGPLNFSQAGKAAGPMSGGCLMTLLLLPFMTAFALLRRRRTN
jgi:hypothetical protein